MLELLTSGGDARIICDPRTGCNKYACPPTPQPAVLTYGSSTASIISSAGFAAAKRLYRRLQDAVRADSASAVYAAELLRIRAELLRLCDIDVPGLEVVFGASGTDLHLLAARLAAAAAPSTLQVITVEPAETGSGVPTALTGVHADSGARHGGGHPGIDVAVVALRGADGTPLPAKVVDAEVESLAASAVAAGRRVLLNVADVSKTGLIGPSIGCALALRSRFSAALDVMIDGCQFRLAFPTLRAYLANGFWVALTGSKFVTGPAFSGALLLPPSAALELRQRALPAELGASSVRGDWPMGWEARAAFDDVANFGLLLRWEAALAELRQFASLPESEVAAFLEVFAAIVGRRLDSDPAFERLAVPTLDRAPLAPSACWDRIPTIFPFLLRRPGARGDSGLLPREATTRVYRQLGRDLGQHPGLRDDEVVRDRVARRCQLGQPVVCGVRSGIPVSALRLCNSMRLVNDAVAPNGRGAYAVIADALCALDKVAWLADQECF